MGRVHQHTFNIQRHETHTKLGLDYTASYIDGAAQGPRPPAAERRGRDRRAATAAAT